MRHHCRYIITAIQNHIFVCLYNLCYLSGFIIIMYFILNPLISSVWPVPTVCIRIFWLAPKASCLYSRFCEIEALCCYNHQSVLIVSNGNNVVYPISVYITHLDGTIKLILQRKISWNNYFFPFQTTSLQYPVCVFCSVKPLTAFLSRLLLIICAPLLHFLWTHPPNPHLLLSDASAESLLLQRLTHIYKLTSL